MSETSEPSERTGAPGASAITRRTHARLLPSALFIATALSLAAYVAYRVYGAIHGNP